MFLVYQRLLFSCLSRGKRKCIFPSIHCISDYIYHKWVYNLYTNLGHQSVCVCITLDITLPWKSSFYMYSNMYVPPICFKLCYLFMIKTTVFLCLLITVKKHWRDPKKQITKTKCKVKVHLCKYAHIGPSE